MLSVEDLLQTEHLQLRLHNPGPHTKLSSPVSWAHPTELPDPAAWLPERSIILTLGAGLHGSADKQRALVRHAVLRQCSGIGFGLGLWLDTIPDQICEEANEYGLPLIVVPYEVSFAEIIKTINQHNFFEHNRPLFDATGFLRLCATAHANATTVDAFLRIICESDHCLKQLHFQSAHDVSCGSSGGASSGPALRKAPVYVGGMFAGQILDSFSSSFVHEDTVAFYTSMLSVFIGQKISEASHEHFQVAFHEDRRVMSLLLNEAGHEDRLERLALVRRFIGSQLTAASIKLPTFLAATVVRWMVDQTRRSDDTYLSVQDGSTVFVLRRASESFDEWLRCIAEMSHVHLEIGSRPVQFEKCDAGLDCFRTLLRNNERHHAQNYYTTLDAFFEIINQSTSGIEKQNVVQAICPRWSKLKLPDRSFVLSNLEIHLRLFGRPGDISKALRISRQSWYQRLAKLQDYLAVDIKDALSVPPLWSFLTIVRGEPADMVSSGRAGAPSRQPQSGERDSSLQKI